MQSTNATNSTNGSPSNPYPQNSITSYPNTNRSFLLLGTMLASLCPASNHPPPIFHLTPFQLHRLHQIPHARSLTLLSVFVPRAVVVRCRAVEAAVVFGQSYQTDDEGGPVFDGVGGNGALVLAEFEGARLSCGKGLTSVFDSCNRNA